MEEKISRGRFVRLGAALGVGAASASVLAACGGNGSGENGSGGGNGGDTADAPAPESIASESDVEPGGSVGFTDGGDAAVLIRREDDSFVAYSAVCTHQQCEVNYQQDAGELVCPCHGSIFDPADGSPTQGPAQEPLREIPVEVRDGQVVQMEA